MPAVTLTGYAHVRLTVSDITRSRDFYENVLGLPVAFEVPDGADAATREALGFLYGGVIYDIGGSGLLGLRPVADGADRFDEDRLGLDHVSFSVAARADLDAAAAHLDGLGVAHEPVKDTGAGAILELRDPDGIALELCAPAG